jgi:vacuole morphology and inheritance protein 14
MPGQGVKVDYAAIVEILIRQLDPQSLRILFPTSKTNLILDDIDDEIQQSTALRWLAEFLSFVHEVMVPFTPRLIPAILPNLAHHVTMIQSAAIRTNKLLLNVIQTLPSPSEGPSRTPRVTPASPPPTTQSAGPSRQTTKDSAVSSRDVPSPELDTQTPLPPPVVAAAAAAAAAKSRITVARNPSTESMPPPPVPVPAPPNPSRPLSPISSNSSLPHSSYDVEKEVDLFDYQATVNELTIQFLSEYEETRVAALKWLIMLHQKAPKKVCCSLKPIYA